MSLAVLRFAALRNAAVRSPLRHLGGALLLALVAWGEFAAGRRGVGLLARAAGDADIVDALLRRSLEALFLLLMAGVAFSVLVNAVSTLFDAEDLPFLLSLPVPARRVFALKTAETFATSAGLPALFTLPFVAGAGAGLDAPPWLLLPVAVVAVAALYALPVAAGCVAAVALVRVAPAGRVKEVATAAGVGVAAALVVALRALRPERLADLAPEAFDAFLLDVADLGVGWLPTSWASAAVLEAVEGRVPWGLAPLLLLSLGALGGASWLASRAYRAGWLRGLDDAAGRAAPGYRPAAAWERPLARLGPGGALVVKDVRLLARDPAQWSQLLVLAALAGTYLVSTASVEVPGRRFQDALGAMNLLVQAFLLAGVGVRTAFPAVSLEGEGFWFLRTGPVRARDVVWAKFLHALPPMLLLGAGIGGAAAWLLDLSPSLAWASPFAGAASAVAVTGLGVGLGAAFPRFDAVSPAHVPLSVGGVVYMALAFAYAAALTVLLAWPAWRALRAPGERVWSTSGGLLAAGLALALTALATVAPLAWGAARLAAWEPTKG